MAKFVTPEQAVILGYVDATGKYDRKIARRLPSDVRKIAKQLADRK